MNIINTKFITINVMLSHLKSLTHLALALDGGPELAELGEVDALIPVLDPEVNILKIFWKKITTR